MSDNSVNQQTAKSKTWFGKIIGLPFSVFGILCGSLLLSIMIECLGLYFIWSDQGWHHAQTMFNYELKQLSTTFTQSLILSNPVQVANTVLSYSYEWIFIKSGLLEQINAVLTPNTNNAGNLTFRYYLNVAVTQLQNYLLAAAFTTLTFIVRLFVLVLSMPLIFMAILVGLIDGLVKRDIRRFMAGHESGFIYHRARAFLIPTITLPWVIYLALPCSVSPLFIMLPCALFAGVVMNITASSFKKYL